ncbi:MAG: PstS family phosphate ABC transporter substrate-binding protein [Cytophagaceae bacterium]|jgi:phosphate transport system substrate-binding protein|nr:PstS family phosphate ABC transporter substrate-binding protein [Cytophagaceae bacterium]
MKKSIVFLISAALLWSCGGSEKTKSTDSTAIVGGDIKIDGSSTVYPISEAFAEEFQKENNEVKVTVAVSGTGGGFKKFIRKEIDVTGASRPIKKSENEDAVKAGIEYYEIPVAYDGLAVVINPQNTWVDFLTVEELKKIWEPAAQGKIVKWNQIRPNWPNEEIHLFGAGTESGTFDYFTEAIVGESKACRGDYTASEDDNVLVQGVAGDKLALAFFGYAYYKENAPKLKIVPIDDKNDTNGKGAIAPNESSIIDGSYQPLSRPLFIYVNKASADRTEVSAFVNYALQNASILVPETGYVPLTSATYVLAKKRFDTKKTGSVFLQLESTVGVKLEDVLKVE